MRNRRQLVIVIVSLALPPLLIIILPTSVALALQIPGDWATRKLGASGYFALTTSLLLCWASLALLISVFIKLIIGKGWTPKVLLLGLIICFCALLVVTGHSQKDHVFVGTFEYGFERSDFYPNGQCWRPPYWLVPVPELHGQMNSLGRSIVTVKFVGDETSIGRYGHMGAYLRQVKVVRVLAVGPARPCS